MKDVHSTKSTEYIDTFFHLKFCNSDLVFVLLFFKTLFKGKNFAVSRVREG